MQQYKDLVKTLLDKYRRTNKISNDRTNVGTVKIFGHMMRFDLNEGFPLVTIKKTNFQSIVRELLWFLKGSTDNKELQAAGCNIWTPWAVKEVHIVDYYRDIDDWEHDSEFRDILNHPSETVTSVDDPAYWPTVLDRLIKAEFIPESARLMIGQLGPIYSKTWTAWEDIRIVDESIDEDINDIFADYGFMDAETDSDARVVGRSINQIQNVVDALKTNPNSRRIIVSAWDPRHLPDETKSPQRNVMEGRAALAYCHAMFQFATEELTYTERCKIYGSIPTDAAAELITVETLDESGTPTHRLSCMVTQRSADVPLGVPFNIASYALLTMMMAQVCNMELGDLIWSGGDVHIYANQIDAMSEVVERDPLPLPTVNLNINVRDIFDFTEDDIVLCNYNHHGPVKMDPAV